MIFVMISMFCMQLPKVTLIDSYLSLDSLSGLEMITPCTKHALLIRATITCKPWVAM